MLASFSEAFAAATGIIAPIFLIVLLGYGCRRYQVIDDHFIDTASNLVFKLALPALLFFSIIRLDLARVIDWPQISYAVTVTLAGTTILWMISGKFVMRPDQRGVFVQGAFRGNLGIIGIALCERTYGAPGLAQASVLLGVITLFYNLLSVWVLQAANTKQQANWRLLMGKMARNPLIISIILAIIWNAGGIPLPTVFRDAGDYFAAITLPLALLCVGGSLDLKRLRSPDRLTMSASAIKLILLPGAQIILASALGFTGLQLGVLALMLLSPTATVSFVMAKAMRGDADLAANIVAFSTLASVISLTFALTGLQIAGLR